MGLFDFIGDIVNQTENIGEAATSQTTSLTDDLMNKLKEVSKISTAASWNSSYFINKSISNIGEGITGEINNLDNNLKKVQEASTKASWNASYFVKNSVDKSLDNQFNQITEMFDQGFEGAFNEMSNVTDIVGDMVDDFEPMIAAIVDFTNLNVEVIKELIGLFPIVTKILKNIVPILKASTNTIQTLLLLAPILVIFLGIARLIKALER